MRNVRRVFGVEYLVTGFVSQLDGYPGFKLKVIDTKDAQVLFSQKVEGTLAEAAARAAELFHERSVFDRYDTTFVTKQRKVPQLSDVTRTIQVVSQQSNEDPVLGVLLMLIIAGVVVLTVRGG
jgi:curli biogenesis system outer membrane secretion channel CsgG